MDKILNQYGSQLINNKETILSVVKKYNKALAYASNDLLNDEAFIINAISLNSASLHYAKESHRANFEIVLAAVKNNGKSLKYASDALKNNNEIVFAAVSNKGNSLKYASSTLKKEKSIVLEAVKNGCAVEHIPLDYLSNDEEIISIILDRPYKSKFSLKLANENIRNNKKIVLKAVKSNGLDLEFASENLKNDIEIVKVAADQTILALGYTNLSFSEIKEIAKETLKGNQFRWYYNPKKTNINLNKFSVIAAIYFNVHQLHRADNEYKNDKELMLFAIEMNATCYHYASDSLKKDKDIVLAALNHDDYKHFIINNYIRYICASFKNDSEILKKLSDRTGLSLKELENYEQYLNAKTIMEKWIYKLVPETKKLLNNCKSLFYPGAYHDFSTIQFFIENSSVKNFYYTDYMNMELNETSILIALENYFTNWGYQITKFKSIEPSYFNEPHWESFWYPDPSARSGSDTSLSFITKYLIEKEGKTWSLYYFGTEATATYEVLLKNKVAIDVIVTQDHGLGGCWTSFCNNSLIEKIAEDYNSLPKMILSGGEAWKNYEEASDWFGKFGMHEGERKLWKHS